MSIAQRNEKAKKFILDRLEIASKLSEEDFKNLPNYQKLISILNDLIPVKAKGFRGIVATAITGKFLDPTYDPLNNFYDCNPRSIFEQGIFYAFENRIPCGKSDPLNVAKNINVLDDEWAKGKRPQKAAQAVVSYLKQIEVAPESEKEDLIDLFFFKLLQYAELIRSVDIVHPKPSKFSHQLFSKYLSRFLSECPESGAIPQLVVSKLVQKIYAHAHVTVLGGDESVFGTNTTSKKPADIWLEYQNTPFSLFEITVKKVDYKRLDDCIQSLKSLNMLDLPIHFICRFPTDIADLSDVHNNTLEYKGKVFNFLDIEEFIRSISALLSNTQIEEMVNEIHKFISDINRPVNTKEVWNKIFG